MGTVSGNWITGTHRGRACRHENLYTKVNKKTGACYSVKLCNPNSEWTEDQLSHRSEFGLISSAISAWIKENKETSGTNHADYVTVKAKFDRQTKYATLRGYMYAKGMYTISDGIVTVDITASTVSSGSNGTTGGTTTSKYTISLSASPANGGTVSGAGSYDAGSTANISATAASGYTFSRWSDGNTSESRTITVNENNSLTAIFTANSSGGGNNDSGDYVS